MKKILVVIGLIITASCNDDDQVDVLQPQILSISPVDLATEVPVDEVISVTFSESIDENTIVDNFILSVESDPVNTELNYNDETLVATLTPVASLVHGGSYEVHINGGLTDLAGNAVADTSWVFSTIELSVATYEVTFNATWSADTHPTEFPSSPHFSGLIGMTHNEDAALYEVGELASLGIKDMAERGQKGSLTNEINSFIEAGTGYSIIDGGGVNPSPGNVSVQFNIGIDHTYATITTMIAPSPDWYLAEIVNLMENDLWVDLLEVNCIAYDAGTDSGVSFASANLVTNPPENVFVISEPPLGVDGAVVPMGTFKFVRIQ